MAAAGQFTDTSIALAIFILFILLSIIVLYWRHNRKKFQSLSHQIPASVVKNYLDSIIQNSSALKSSLFRGGGLDTADGIPSVVPVADLPRGNINQGDFSEELSQKSAQISSLRQELENKERLILDLEDKITDIKDVEIPGSDELEQMKIHNQKLNDELGLLKQQAGAAIGSASVGEDNSEELLKLQSERDELKERLQEYEIIEEDLANLKKLQQENDQLKQTISDFENEGSEAASDEDISAVDDILDDDSPDEDVDNKQTDIADADNDVSENDTEDLVAAEDSSESSPAGPESSDDQPHEGQNEKSAEDLLSEFEKMLG